MTTRPRWEYAMLKDAYTSFIHEQDSDFVARTQHYLTDSIYYDGSNPCKLWMDRRKFNTMQILWFLGEEGWEMTGVDPRVSAGHFTVLYFRRSMVP
jgi:hypothetical protein